MLDLIQRPRRNRKNKTIRQLVSENEVQRKDLIFPVFVVEGQKQKQEITSMPGQFRYSIDQLLPLCEQALKKGVQALALFPAIEEIKKNAQATEALNPDNLVNQTLAAVKKEFPEMILITDLALDPFSSEGHDGLVEDGKILNDETVEILAKMAVLHAHGGADIVAPSDMMDGRVAAIRDGLDANGFTDTSILAYTAKYASAFYGPFREALDSAPKFGDKKTYQLSPRNIREALMETKLDEEEGADMIMVKPALPYLDIIARVREQTDLPVAAYNVSGEYAMVMAAVQNGWLEEKKAIGESLMSIKRAGADCILTYFALHDFEIGY